MKNKLFAILILAFLSFSAHAQKTIAVLNGSNWTFYTDFSTALNQCAPASTIYLPGGTWLLSQGQDTILKELNIIGVGHYSDSTLATKPTILQGSLYFGQGGNNVTLSGIYVNGGINPIPADTVYNLSIYRCRLGYISFTRFINVNVDECIISRLYGDKYLSNNIVIQRSVIEELSELYGAEVKNNVLGDLGYNCSFCGNPPGLYNSSFQNNVIAGAIYTYGSNNAFVNNLFFSSNLPSGSSGNTAINNTGNNTYATTFVSVGSNIFSYSYDYHLLSSSIGKNGGTDGTDIGIYGTSYPYKPSAVPANPHVSTKSISPSSTPNGTLPVNIRVIAQER